VSNIFFAIVQVVRGISMHLHEDRLVCIFEMKTDVSQFTTTNLFRDSKITVRYSTKTVHINFSVSDCKATLGSGKAFR
jgi:hypothetical protein